MDADRSTGAKIKRSALHGALAANRSSNSGISTTCDLPGFSVPLALCDINHSIEVRSTFLGATEPGYGTDGETHAAIISQYECERDVRSAADQHEQCHCPESLRAARVGGAYRTSAGTVRR